MQRFGRALIWTLDKRKITGILIKVERLEPMIILLFRKFNSELPRYLVEDKFIDLSRYLASATKMKWKDNCGHSLLNKL